MRVKLPPSALPVQHAQRLQARDLDLILGVFLRLAIAEIDRLTTGADGSDEAESVALLSGPSYASEDDAEAAGIAWATEQCVTTLYVSRA